MDKSYYIVCHVLNRISIQNFLQCVPFQFWVGFSSFGFALNEMKRLTGVEVVLFTSGCSKLLILQSYIGMTMDNSIY